MRTNHTSAGAWSCIDVAAAMVVEAGMLAGCSHPNVQQIFDANDCGPALCASWQQLISQPASPSRWGETAASELPVVTTKNNTVSNHLTIEPLVYVNYRIGVNHTVTAWKKYVCDVRHIAPATIRCRDSIPGFLPVGQSERISAATSFSAVPHSVRGSIN